LSVVELNSSDIMAKIFSNDDFQAQITELQKMLESVQSIENEVQVLRRQKSAFERDVELASDVQKQGSGGVWRWIAGGNGNS
jgi:serine phosphatase RsbU (regulator of sigma subunit)